MYNISHQTNLPGMELSPSIPPGARQRKRLRRFHSRSGPCWRCPWAESEAESEQQSKRLFCVGKDREHIRNGRSMDNEYTTM